MINFDEITVMLDKIAGKPEYYHCDFDQYVVSGNTYNVVVFDECSREHELTSFLNNLSSPTISK